MTLTLWDADDEALFTLAVGGFAHQAVRLTLPAKRSHSPLKTRIREALELSSLTAHNTTRNTAYSRLAGASR